MRIYLLIILFFCTFIANGQKLFDEGYSDCNCAKACLYCGDSAAYPRIKIAEYIRRKIEHSPNHFVQTSGRMLFEICVDSTGHPCVLSVKDEIHMWDVKNTIRNSINEMEAWHPALLAGRPISSTVILKIHFVGNLLRIGLARKEELDQSE